MRKCNYKHCDKDISGMRPNAKYCSKRHKNYAATCKWSHEKTIAKWVEEENKLVNVIKLLKGTEEI